MRVLAACALAAAPLASGVQARGEELTVALTGKYPPFSFYSETGELAGFDVDVSRALARRLGRPVRFVATEWDGILAGLLAGKYDVIIGSMAITPERSKRVHFTRPYYRSGAQLFIHREDASAIQGLEGLADERVGVVLGETCEQYLRTRHPEIDSATYKSTVDIFQDMANRRLRGFVTDRLVGLHQIKQAGMPFVPAGPLLYREEMAIPVCHGDESLLAALDEALAEMEKDGTLQAIEDRWFGLESSGSMVKAIPTAQVIRRLASGFGKTLLLAAASLLLGLVLALPAGLVLHRGTPWIRLPVRGVVDFVRGTPVLVQLYFVYYGLGSEQVGLDLSPISAAILTLTVNAGAYIAEVVRGGLMAVPAGQSRAAQALGLSRLQVFRHVVWPQAFRVALPSLVNSAVALLKDTALVSVISVAEVLREAQSMISVTFDPTRFYLIVGVMFFVVTYPLMKLAGRLEAGMRKRGFADARD